jgi:putative glutamine amidotransferase
MGDSKVHGMWRPIIGITADIEEAGERAKLPYYFLRQNYSDAITRAGGAPMMLPHEPELAEEYLSRIEGLLVTGGAFDIDPAMFGATTKHATVKTKDRRTQFEAEVAKGAMARNIPVLGICGGQQLLNVLLGGTLFQHIPDEVPNALPHEQPNPRTEPGHEVKVKEGTLLSKITGAKTLHVNSAHHQAAKSVGPGVVVDAVSPDGVIEGIEDPRQTFCLGVQWHPEYGVSAGDEKIFAAFITAAKQ